MASTPLMLSIPLHPFFSFPLGEKKNPARTQNTFIFSLLAVKLSYEYDSFLMNPIPE